MQNIEIKYRLSDPEAVKRILEEREEIAFEYSHHQRDIYFNAPDCRLKIRIEDGKTPHLIEYRRPDQSTGRISEYHLIELDDVDAEIAKQTERFGLIGGVEKQRALYFYKNVRIHLDQVKHLGAFLEFESVISDEYPHDAAQKSFDEITTILKTYLDQPVSVGYINLLKDNG